jgi:hypothetical protein
LYHYAKQRTLEANTRAEAAISEASIARKLKDSFFLAKQQGAAATSIKDELEAKLAAAVADRNATAARAAIQAAATDKSEQRFQLVKAGGCSTQVESSLPIS